MNAPVVEELLFAGALLTGLLYILGALGIRSDLKVFLGVLFAGGPPANPKRQVEREWVGLGPRLRLVNRCEG